MSVVGRLWRRAPAWRLTLAAAVAFTALAAMFPPPRPAWLRAPSPAHAIAPADPTQASPHFAPPPAAPPSDYGVVAFPPPGPDRTGIIPVAGRQVPLPEGTWQELVLARSGGAVAEQASLLARVADGHLTGLLLAASPGPVAQEDAPFGGIAACFLPGTIAHQIIPTTAADGPMARECWTFTPFDREDGAARADSDEVMRGGFDRLDRMSVSVPRHMLALRYIRTGQGGWLSVLLLLPDRRGDGPDATRRLQAWIRRYEGALHKGFDGKLSPADLTAATVRDPD